MRASFIKWKAKLKLKLKKHQMHCTKCQMLSNIRILSLTEEEINVSEWKLILMISMKGPVPQPDSHSGSLSTFSIQE